jgi:hypothetical protein
MISARLAANSSSVNSPSSCRLANLRSMAATRLAVGAADQVLVAFGQAGP